MSQRTDTELLEAMRSGDAEARALFAQRHGDLLLGLAAEICRRDCRMPTGAHDCVLNAIADGQEAVAGVEAPTPSSGNWARKLFAQPDWIVGVVLGALVSALCLLVILPREPLAAAMREPAELAMAKADAPLSGKVGDELSAARHLLARGKATAAIDALNRVLAARPEFLEARWLLATTYDGMGDQAHAAVCYRQYISVASRERAIADERVVQAQERLKRFSELP
ncbi:MAG TPA: alkyl sulfatase dimerization domain-containing protein [Oscillatoriaceae cyanobacterium]